jgi:hypothetical protein
MNLNNNITRSIVPSIFKYKFCHFLCLLFGNWGWSNIRAPLSDEDIAAGMLQKGEQFEGGPSKIRLTMAALERLRSSCWGRGWKFIASDRWILSMAASPHDVVSTLPYSSYSWIFSRAFAKKKNHFKPFSMVEFAHDWRATHFDKV